MEEAPTHFLTDMPLEADGVETTFLFPENRDLALTSGEPVRRVAFHRMPIERVRTRHTPRLNPFQGHRGG
jgi:hypothetical protein